VSAPLENPDARRLLLQAGIVCNLGQASKIIDELSPLLAAEGIDLRRPSPLGPVASLFAVAASLAALAEHDGMDMDDVISGRGPDLAVRSSTPARGPSTVAHNGSHTPDSSCARAELAEWS
jgi:hypothetical protein